MEKYVGTGIFTKDGKELMSFSYEYYLAHKKEIDEELSRVLGDEYVEYRPKRKQNLVKEDGIEYHTDTNKKHDKLFKDLFSDREEMAKFVNKYIKPRQAINKEDIEPYKTEFVTKMFRTKEADIVYKIKNKNIFFLVEHQSTVDLSMAYRILNYKISIMNQAIEQEKMKTRDYKYPNIIAIVLYTGQEKWSAATRLSQLQEQINNKSNNIENLDYILVDTNKKSIDELIEDDLITSKAMIMEKSKEKEEVLINFRLIATKIISEKSHLGEHLLEVLVNYILRKELKQSAIQIIEEIRGRRGEEKMMLNCERVILEENARMRNEGKTIGRAEAKREIIIQMIKNNFKDDAICKVSKISAKELQEIKESI